MHFLNPIITTCKERHSIVEVMKKPHNNSELYFYEEIAALISNFRAHNQMYHSELGVGGKQRIIRL